MKTNVPWNHRAAANRHAEGVLQRAAGAATPTRVGRCALIAALAFAGCTLSAATVKDSADFSGKLEMNSVPAPIYQASKGWTSDGDVLTVNNAQNGDGAFGWSGALQNSKGYTIELRFRITQVNTPGASASALKYTFQMQGADGSGTLALHSINIGKPLADAQLGVYNPSGTLGFAITSNEWHTLRIADEPNSNDMLIWSDGVQITGFDWKSMNNTVNRAWAGDLGVGVVDGVYDVDYFRVDTTGAYAPPAPALPVVVQSPQSVTNDIGARMTLAGNFSGLVSSVQWYKDNVPVANGDKVKLVIDPASAADSGWYFLRATNALGYVDTLPAYVEVLTVDPAPPVVQNVQGLLTLQHLRVTYNKPTTPETQTNTANYTFKDNALTVLNATRIDQHTVELQTQFQTPGSNYTLYIASVVDTLSNPIAAGTSVGFTAPMVNPCVRYDAGTATSQPAGPVDPVSATGGYWVPTTNLNNGMLTNAIVDDMSTGLNAWQITDQNVLSSGGVLDYRMKIDQGSDNFAHTNGWRLMARTRFVDSFMSTAADQAVIYCDTGLGIRYGILFSQDSNGDLNAALLGGSTYVLTSDTFSYHTHVLAYDPATGLVSYYFDGQLIVSSYTGQAASGYDGVAFGSASSTSTGQMNYNLVQFDVLNGAKPQVVTNPQDITIGVGQKVTLSAAFTPFVSAFQWLSNNVIISGATNASWTTGFLGMNDNGSRYVCRALNAMGNVETAPATLSVTADTTPPTITGINYSLTGDRVIITFSERVLASYATNIANYVWSTAGISNVSAGMLDEMTVELRTTPQQMGSSYVLRVSNVRDTSNLSIVANTQVSVTQPSMEVVARYYAGSTNDAPATPPDPTSAAGGSWSLTKQEDANITTNAVVDDMGTGWNAWAVRDASTAVNHFAQYSLPLGGDVQKFAHQHGWILTIRSRFVEDLGTDYTMYAQYGDEQLNRNTIFFDMNAAGDLTANLSTATSFRTYTLTSGGAGAMDYHVHQITYDPVSAMASYYFDGQFITNSWSPVYNASAISGLIWGAGSSGNMGAMNFNLIELRALAAPFARVAVDGANINVQYRGVLEAAGQLGNPTSWSAIATNATGGTSIYSEPVGGKTQQYFRARMLQ